ncbi:acetolactate synthase [Streptomyces abyssalis]|uniref:Acetolactate synthase n=1 Tax=Streptomyces abyssalis TaxID=933944 RepID=A0A1E7JN89_9ACTN|nr:thiamine pyrophosphate-binding protein [Streptomyces abyssalis]OEU86869.1 acetolactate synthase [Streptomyces abyssalis]OEU89747.1 acetolactate synthase [Streptomyces abyssalis]
MIVAEAVGRTLVRLGADRAFGVVGSGNFHVTGAMVAAGARYVAARHESGAAVMADAYARVSGKLGVVTVHQGCGLTNALTGITEAAKSRTPLIVLAADTPAADLRSNFRVDQDALAHAVGARAERVHGPETAVADTVRACRLAVSGRRTVVLNLPVDVQSRQVPLPLTEPEPEPPRLHRPAPAAEAVAELGRLLMRSRRPVFIAGRGALSGPGPSAGERPAADALRELGAATGALLATSAVARGLFHGDPWSLDVSGGFSSPLAAELISGADLVVGWGCALNKWTTRHGALIAPDASLVQVDLDAEAIGAHRPVTLGIVGDTAATASAVTVFLAGGGGQPAAEDPPADGLRGYRSEELRARIGSELAWNTVPYTDDSTDGNTNGSTDGNTDGNIDPRTLSVRLDGLLPRERVLAVDSGNFMGYPAMFLSVPDEQGFCFTQAFQSIGLGLATAIGAALARPDRLPVAALGDGGALMGVSELETVVRLGLPMAVVVYNDRAYGAEVHHFAGDGADLSTVTFPDTDIAALARGLGYTGVTVRGEDDLEAVASWVDGPRSTPLLVDAKITSTEGSWWLKEAFRAH